MNSAEVPDLVSDSSSGCQSSPEMQAFDRVQRMEKVNGELVEIDYACICCDPANTTGYHCPQTYSIVKKKTKRDTESWHSNMIRGDKFREIGILHHEECLGCYKFIPSKFPDVGSRCSCCDSYSCDNITPGGCTRNFSVTQLGSPKLPANSLNWILSNQNAAGLLNRYGSVEKLIHAVVNVLPRAGAGDKLILSNGLVRDINSMICSNCVWRDVVVDGLHLLWKHNNSININN
ncbi:hypothetical protein E3P77_01287 [Wallemia ichthyophaga]|nr:hypothetical protein E3P91_00863 [Wallemia ichthyophaga]TIA83062.1 hypothetical protein E3P98_01009 [Wallemia ichthyophaga]TIB64722.1 hypothetical protein E3P78_00978 [Wallemia ichthyophaga]TIB68108.1 hypothetical protein E3P77_01287 [Wallemia ichthyophaga]